MNRTELTLAESLARASSGPRPAPHRMNLNVPFADKDRAKAVGAKWDKSIKAWYIEADQDMRKFSLWLR